MLVVSVPLEHAESVRAALAVAGAGVLGNYTNCSFSYRGVGRFLPLEASNPAYGTKGELSLVEEERIEMLCDREKISVIVAALRAAHPYEEPAFHFFSVEIDA